MACLPMMLLVPLAASLIQMAISRAREFEAGRGGSPISGDPHGSAGVLLQIHRVAPRGTLLPPSEAHPETAQMMIVNPPSAGGLRGLFSTHPAVEERVERLLAMGNG